MWMTVIALLAILPKLRTGVSAKLTAQVFLVVAGLGTLRLADQSGALVPFVPILQSPATVLSNNTHIMHRSLLWWALAFDSCPFLDPVSPVTRIVALCMWLKWPVVLVCPAFCPSIDQKLLDPLLFFPLFSLPHSTIRLSTMSLNTKEEGAGVAPQNKGSWSSFLKVFHQLELLKLHH